MQMLGNIVDTVYGMRQVPQRDVADKVWVDIIENSAVFTNISWTYNLLQ